MENPVAEALVTGTDQALREALRTSRVAVVAAGREGRAVPAVLTGPDGVRTLAVFSGQDTFELWGRPEMVLMVAGAELGTLATGQPVDRVLFDLAGPTPVGFAPAALQAIIEGVVSDADGGQVLVGDQDFRSAPADDQTLALRKLAGRLVRPPGEAYLLHRVVGGHAAVTLGVFAPEADVSDILLGLSGAEGIGEVDVVVLDAATRDVVREQIPQSRVNPA